MRVIQKSTLGRLSKVCIEVEWNLRGDHVAGGEDLTNRRQNILKLFYLILVKSFPSAT